MLVALLQAQLEFSVYLKSVLSAEVLKADHGRFGEVFSKKACTRLASSQLAVATEGTRTEMR